MSKQSALDIIERFDKALNSRDYRFCFVCLSERVIPRYDGPRCVWHSVG